MIEKIIFDKDLIRRIVNKKDVSILFIKLDPKEKKAFYRTDTCANYKFIDIQKVIDL